jgi:Autophagy-related protein 11
MVHLYQRVEELERALKDEEAELTEAQAREAILEAELVSVKKILEKTSADLSYAVSRERKASERPVNSPIVDRVEKLEIMSDNKSVDSDLRSKRDSNVGGKNLGSTAHLCVAREQLDDLCIVTRMGLKQLDAYFSAFSQLAISMCPNRVPQYGDFTNFNFAEVLDMDTDDLGSDLETFLNRISLFTKCAYSKIMKSSSLINPTDCLADIKLRYETLAIDNHNNLKALGLRVSFENFGVGHLVLFLPSKSRAAWAAFNINAPNYFLVTDSHAGFESRLKYCWITVGRRSGY